MSSAMQIIVAGYVKIRDRCSLEALIAHRQKVLVELQAVTGIDPAGSISVLKDEINLIEAGPGELKPPPGTLPEDEWS
jgi:hypothetical protein